MLDPHQIGRFSVHLIQDGWFRIPGDSFYQKGRNAGTVLPFKTSPLLLGMTCLLIRDEKRLILVDTGLGEKPLDDLVLTYGIVLPRKLNAGLAALGVQPPDVDIVILTHLHWDHAGGSTKLDENGNCIPAFPNAEYVVQQAEWDWAMNLSEEDRDDYHRENFLPLREHQQLRLMDGPQEIIPGIRVELTGGHSPGHQVVWIEDEGETALFLADLVPTPKLIDLNWTMKYDNNPEQVIQKKKDILGRAVDAEAVLVFQHAPRMRCGVLRKDRRGVLSLERIS
jgi:glyoxylase-like metal-dependent hydrolase (beta-lactamase superfamily II)